MALTVCIHLVPNYRIISCRCCWSGWIWSPIISWSIISWADVIIVGGYVVSRSQVFRACSINRFSSFISKSKFAIGTVTLTIPHGTILDNPDTDIFPFSKSFIAFNAGLLFRIPILAVHDILWLFFRSEYSVTVNQDNQCQ